MKQVMYLEEKVEVGVPPVASPDPETPPFTTDVVVPGDPPK